MQRQPHIIKRLWTAANDFADITARRHLFLLAGGIAFNQVLCLIPFGLVAIGIASGVMDEASTKESVQRFMSNLFPEGTEAAATVGSVVHELTLVFNYGTVAGWVAAVILLWTASALFSSLRTGLNAVFEVETPKFFLVYKLKDIALTIVTVLLVIIATFASPLLSVVESIGSSFVPDDAKGIVLGFTARMISLAVTTVLFVFLYWMVPNQRLPRGIVLASTAVAVVLWEIARVVFAWYITSASNLGRFYGGYVVLASIALWAYYSSLVFLLSAEVGQFVFAAIVRRRARRG
jgi:YihY family inner membrane protein